MSTVLPPGHLIGQISAYTRELLDYLLLARPGQILTYEELSAIIGRPVLGVRHVLTSARYFALRDHRIVFGVLPRQGIQRLTDVETTDFVPIYFAKARGASKRVLLTLSAVDYSALPQTKQLEYLAHQATAATVHHFSAPKNQRLIRAKIAESGKALAIEDTLRLFLGHTK